MKLSAPVLLEKRHDIQGFDCGKAPLQQHALGNQAGGGARTYVVVDEALGAQVVVGYYSLAPAAVRPEEAPERVLKGQARHPIPCILLARLAVDTRAQGRGLGASLFRDALLRALNAHQQIGGRAFLVHAMDAEARRFYERYGMMPSGHGSATKARCRSQAALRASVARAKTAKRLSPSPRLLPGCLPAPG